MIPIKSQPLYKLIKQSIVSRIADGEWSPGTFLPSEPAIAKEYDVSHGTVRRALDELTHEHKLIRYQGKGTAVALLDDKQALFKFFRLHNEDGTPVIPTSENLEKTADTMVAEQARKEEAQALALDEGETVYRIERLRLSEGTPICIESITLPAKRFPALHNTEKTLPNTLYSYYQERYGIIISHTEEKMTATIATPHDANLLRVAPASALLAIRRVCFDIENQPVEYRYTKFLTQSHHYSIQLP